ncbi:Hypothetical protein PHPALM_37692 [Phytophthora palmivora]|uniref:Uncharacterized protein n=1 Tax=Phytophthora palmivora TaxID=4796 RepID=A0A2P4WWS3_9STRA|nr:Hypothetical protein PHPALM_37692 [Phytophthora palmivora]
MELPAPPDASVLAPLPFVLRFCSLVELQQLSQVSHDVSGVCEPEWRLRTLARFGELRFVTSQWRRCFLLRSQFRRKAAEQVTARVYLMNNRGETRFFPVERGTPLMCSRERAVVYNRCKRMFDLSLRINRSIQEISTLIGMVSVDEARGLLNEHISLMASVAALRGSLNFESELFQIFPAPVLLDTNSLLRVTHKFQEEEDAEFLQASLMMMQVWASIDGLIYRPLAPPAMIQETPDRVQQVGDNVEETATYASLKLHELSGMTISIDDNTLRYRLQRGELCVNALVSNTYLLYLFNPLQYRPLDWTFDAMLQVGDTRYVLPVQREGVFLNTTSYALRVFLSYGKLPEKSLSPSDVTSDNQEQENASAEVAGAAAASATPSTSGARGAEDSDPLEIPYDGQREIFAFHLTATNRISKKTFVVASKATCLSLVPSPSGTSIVDRRLRQVSIESSSTGSDDEEEDESDTSTKSPNTYVEFAIGFEPLMHLLDKKSD